MHTANLNLNPKLTLTIILTLTIYMYPEFTNSMVSHSPSRSFGISAVLLGSAMCLCIANCSPLAVYMDSVYS